MKPKIERSDLVDSFLDGGGDLKQTQVFRIDEFSAQKLSCDERAPVVPVVTAGCLEAHDRLRCALPGLGKGQDFESFVMGAESSGEEGDRAGFFLENQFPGEEIFERHQLRIVRDRRVGTLLERQQDVYPETVLPTGSFLRGTHDPVGTTRDDHETLTDYLLGEFERDLIVGVV